MRIRKFKDADGQEVKRLILSILKKEFALDAEAYPETDLDNIPETYGGIRDVFFVAEEEGKIVGTVGVKEEAQRVALLRRLFVHPKYRRRKFGSNLLERALDFCKNKGYHEIIFRSTTRMVSAINLCRKKGFLETEQANLGEIKIVKFTFNC